MVWRCPETLVLYPQRSAPLALADLVVPNMRIIRNLAGSAFADAFRDFLVALLAGVQQIEAGQDEYRIISSLPDTIGTGDMILEINVSGSLDMPSPTLGRKLIFKVPKSSAATVNLTYASAIVEDYDGNLKTSVSLIPGESRCYRGNGSSWLSFVG